MAKLNQTQRYYIIEQLVKEALKPITAKVEKGIPKIFIDTRNYRVVPYMHNKNGGFKVALQLGYGLSEKTCSSLKSSATEFASSTGLSSEWYRKEYDADNFEAVTDFEECMHTPRVSLEFKNEKRALKALRSKIARTFEKEYHKLTDVVSEARYDVLELNKWIKNEVLPKCMLTDDGVELLKELRTSMPK